MSAISRKIKKSVRVLGIENTTLTDDFSFAGVNGSLLELKNENRRGFLFFSAPGFTPLNSSEFNVWASTVKPAGALVFTQHSWDIFNNTKKSSLASLDEGTRSSMVGVSSISEFSTAILCGQMALEFGTPLDIRSPEVQGQPMAWRAYECEHRLPKGFVKSSGHLGEIKRVMPSIAEAKGLSLRGMLGRVAAKSSPYLLGWQVSSMIKKLNSAQNPVTGVFNRGLNRLSEE